MARGTIQKRPGPQGAAYRVRVEVDPDPVTGKRIQKSETFKTRKEAETRLAAWLADVDRGTAINPTKMTVAELLNHWLTTVAQDRVKPTTLEDYAATVQKHIIPAIGAVPVQRLTAAQVQAFYATKRASGTGSRTIQLCHLRLSQALAWAERMGMVARNVCDVVEKPKHTTAEMKVWTPEEARRFIKQAEDTPWHTLFLLILSTGLRRGEALGLTWRDVDLDAGTLTVRQTVVTLKSKAHIQTPKSNAARRSVKLPPETVAALRQHRVKQLEHRLKIGDRWQDHDLVFATDTGTVIHPSNVNRAAKTIATKANIPIARVHELRHAHATWLLLSGLPIKVVSERLGHAKASITLDVYAHLIPGAQDAAVETTSAILFATGS